MDNSSSSAAATHTASAAPPAAPSADAPATDAGTVSSAEAQATNTDTVSLKFDDLFRDDSKIDTQQANKWLTSFPDLNFLRGNTPKKFNTESFLKNKFLLRRSMIDNWNQIVDAHEEYNNTAALIRQTAPYQRVLSAPSGTGKSYEAWFYAVCAHSRGWVLEYIASAPLWVHLDPIAGSIDAAACAQYWLEVFNSLNAEIMPSTECNIDFDCPVTKGKREFANLCEFAAYGSKNRQVATQVNTKILQILSEWDTTPVLRIIDEHNALWGTFHDALGNEQKIVNHAYFQGYGQFETHKGLRIFSVYAGSQHSKFEDNVKSGVRSNFKYVQPYSDDEFKAIKADEQYPELFTQNDTAVRELTGLLPRDLADLFNAYAENLRQLDFAKIRKSWEVQAYDGLQQKHDQFVDELESGARKAFFSDLGKLILPPSTAVSVHLGKYRDRGLLYLKEGEEKEKTWAFRNQFARRILVQSYIQNGIQSDVAMLAQVMDLPDTGTGSRGDIWEQLVFRTFCSTTEVQRYRTANQFGVSTEKEVMFQVGDMITLETGEHVPAHPHSSNVLIRGYSSYPVWDFFINKVFIQVSISCFTGGDAKAGNTGGGGHDDSATAKVSNSFEEGDDKWDGKSQVAAFLDAYTGNEGHGASVKDGVLTVTDPEGHKVEDVRFLYICARRAPPNSGRRRAKYTNMEFLYYDNLPGSLQNIIDNATKLTTTARKQPANKTKPLSSKRKAVGEALPKKLKCRHKQPKCLAGTCKHACCKS